MSKRIFRSFAVLIVLAILLTFAAMEYVSYQEARASMRSWAEEDTKLLSEMIAEYGTDAVNAKTAGTIQGRVTLIAADGTVLFDSEENSAQMENHLERPEVRQAFENGTGSATRLSETFGKQTFYYALRAADGSVVRVSRTTDTIFGEIFSRIGIAAALIALLVVLELFLARSVTRRIVAPINAINLSSPHDAAKGAVYEELDPLLNRIEKQNEQIRLQMEELKQAEAVRRDFTANVSHELKTPLMSISGYAELIENGLAKQKDIKNFASRIHAEAIRLTNLVGDILRLSRLEDENAENKTEDVDLYSLCAEVAETLLPYAGEMQVQFTFKGVPAIARGSKQSLFEMIYNLCDNAIKYSRPGGHAELLLSREGGRAVVSVRDDGIGIAPEDQDRIFERFYRVDKSRSRSSGGTGLGLSIVKHAAMRCGAELQMTSEPGKGSEFKVLFPKADPSAPQS